MVEPDDIGGQKYQGDSETLRTSLRSNAMSQSPIRHPHVITAHTAFNRDDRINGCYFSEVPQEIILSNASIDVYCI